MMTYKSNLDAKADRARLVRLQDALNAAKNSLRRDECGAWCIEGRCGRVYTWGDGSSYCVQVRSRSKRHWTATKNRLTFCTLTQDGEEEGVFRLTALPTEEQARALRTALGLYERRAYSPETVAALAARLKQNRARYDRDLASAEARSPVGRAPRSLASV